MTNSTCILRARSEAVVLSEASQIEGNADNLWSQGFDFA